MSEEIKIIESILFVAGDAVAIESLAKVLNLDTEALQTLLDDEIERRVQEKEALLFRRVEDKVQLATNPCYADYVSAVLGETSGENLSGAMLETLAIVAYKQPVTKVEIEALRGVNSSYMIHALLERGLIKEAGRKETIGRPILYATDENFLRHFGLSSVKELPPLPEKE